MKKRAKEKMIFCILIGYVVLLFYIFLIVFIPLVVNLIDKFLPCMQYDNNWLLFWGSVTGGLFTLIGVLITINYYKTQEKENWEKTNRPILIIKEPLPEEKIDQKYYYYFRRHRTNKDSVCFVLRNIGAGTALIYDAYFRFNTEKYFSAYEKRKPVPLYIEKESNCEFTLHVKDGIEKIVVHFEYMSMSGKEYKDTFIITLYGGEYEVLSEKELEIFAQKVH